MSDVVIGARVPKELRDRLVAAMRHHPYRVTLTQAIMRGVELVTAELEAMGLEEPPPPGDPKSRRIADQGVGIRLYNACRNEGIETVDQLARRTRSEFARMPHVGGVTVRDAEFVLGRFGLKFRSETGQP